LAVAIAYRAIQNGFDAFFTTAATLIDDLSAAFRAGELAQALPTYTHPAVLVVDEVGYLTYGTDAANMLFHVVNERHRRKRAMIFTTNKALKAWAACSTTKTSRRPSSTVCSNGAVSFGWTARPSAPCT
jgi:DNA replication protein DnaC